MNNRKSIIFWFKIHFLKIYYTMNQENCTFIHKKNMKIDMFVFLYTCRKLIVMIFLIMSKIFPQRSQYKRWRQNLLGRGGRKQRPCTAFWWNPFYHLGVPSKTVHARSRSSQKSLYRSGLISRFDTDKIEIMLSKIGSLKYERRNG